MILRQHGWYNLWVVAGPLAMGVPEEMDSTTAAAKIKSPAVFLSAQDDHTVPPANQQLVFDAYAGPKRIVTYAGGHNDPWSAETRQQVQAALDWLWQAAGAAK
jgi:fermentation-respiration switch protein FrsA (DUF1100 family)